MLPELEGLLGGSLEGRDWKMSGCSSTGSSSSASEWYDGGGVMLTMLDWLTGLLCRVGASHCDSVRLSERSLVDSRRCTSPGKNVYKAMAGPGLSLELSPENVESSQVEVMVAYDLLYSSRARSRSVSNTMLEEGTDADEGELRELVTYRVLWARDSTQDILTLRCPTGSRKFWHVKNYHPTLRMVPVDTEPSSH